MNRKAFLKLLGPIPQKTKLLPKIIDKRDCGSYLQEKIEYRLEKNETARSYVLIPKKITAKTPAVVCHHQHASNYNLGKSEIIGLTGNKDLAYAKELAERGYITLAADAIAFEERNWHPNKESWWGIEYFELASRLVRGQTLLAKVLHDISVGIDYLISRPEVDKNNIGFIGHSYGGRMALFAPAFDQRIKASISNCYCVNYKNSLKKFSGTRIPMELCVPNFLKYGDVGDVVKLIEPNSLYLSVVATDKWCRDVKQIYNYAKPFFKKGELKIKTWPGQHSFTKAMREEAYLFLDKHLKK